MSYTEFGLDVHYINALDNKYRAISVDATTGLPRVARFREDASDILLELVDTKQLTEDNTPYNSNMVRVIEKGRVRSLINALTKEFGKPYKTSITEDKRDYCYWFKLPSHKSKRLLEIFREQLSKKDFKVS